MNDDNKTPSESPFARVVERLLEKHVTSLRADLEKAIADGNAHTAILIGNALGVWRADVEERLDGLLVTARDHEARLQHLEQALRRASADTEPPEPPAGMRQ